MISKGGWVKMVDVVIIGNVCYDEGIFYRANGSTTSNKTCGGACYFSSIAASLFSNVGMVAKVGNDYDLSFLNVSRINLEGLQIVDDLKTTVFKTYFTSLDGQERKIIGSVHEGLLLSPSDIPKSYLSAKCIHIATNEPQIQYDLVKFLKSNSNAIISIDTISGYSSDKITRQAFDLADIAIIEDKFEFLLQCNAKNKIVKHGKYGVDLLINGLKIEFKNENIIQEVVDKTGAGDIFAGSFMGCLSAGMGLKQSISKAMKIATFSVSKYGAEHLLDLQPDNSVLE